MGSEMCIRDRYHNLNVQRYETLSRRTIRHSPNTYGLYIAAQTVPSRTTMAKTALVRQPYSVAVPSTGGRLHPLVPEGFCPPEQGELKGA